MPTYAVKRPSVNSFFDVVMATQTYGVNGVRNWNSIVANVIVSLAIPPTLGDAFMGAPEWRNIGNRSTEISQDSDKHLKRDVTCKCN